MATVNDQIEQQKLLEIKGEQPVEILWCRPYWASAFRICTIDHGHLTTVQVDYRAPSTQDWRSLAIAPSETGSYITVTAVADGQVLFDSRRAQDDQPMESQSDQQKVEK